MLGALLATIAVNKAENGYLIGVDEVLTGMWRSGDYLLAHQPLIANVDVTSMSKATSDMRFPVSWALCTNSVYDAANRRNPSLITIIDGYYHNAIGMHVGLEAVRAGLEHFADPEVSYRRLACLKRLEAVVEKCEIMSKLTIAGNLIRLSLDRRLFPFDRCSAELHLTELAISQLLIERCGVMIINMRLFMPNILDEDLFSTFTDRLEQGLSGFTPRIVYDYLLERYPGLPLLVQAADIAR